MSYHEYMFSQKLEADKDACFYGFIMAAMRRADDVNTVKLKAMYPEVWQELYDRYNAPGGVIPEDATSKGLVIEEMDL